MDPTTALAGVVDKGYDRHSDRQSRAQQQLQAVRRELPTMVPPGMRVQASGAGQSLPVVPWIAILDPEVTTTAPTRPYIVYLYASSLSRVF